MKPSYFDLIERGNYVGKTFDKYEVWRFNDNFYLYYPDEDRIERIVSDYFLKKFCKEAHLVVN